MYISKRVILLLLCAAMLTSVLAACDADDQHTHETGEPTTGQLHTHTPAAAVQENYLDSSCTATGSYDEVVYCSACQEEISRTQKTVDKKPHEYTQKIMDSAYLQSPATEDSPAVYYYSCNCGQKGTDTFVSGNALAHTHTEIVDPANEATCTSTGLTEGKHCSACGKVLIAQTVVPMKAHSEVIDAAVDATCTTTGLTEGKHCSVCNKTLVAQQEAPKIAHTYDDKYDKTCNKCGFVRDAECAHTNTEVIPGRAATCTSAGLTDGTNCKKCGEILVAQTIIAAKGHTEVVDRAVAPDCLNAGLTEGKHCSVCNTVTVEQKVIAALGHKYEAVVTVPTCTAEGYTTHTCSVCNDTYIDSKSAALGHTEVVDAAKNATCTESGLTEGKHCSACNAVLVAQQPLEKLPHTESNWIVDKEPTASEAGLKHIECTMCGKKIKEEILPAKGYAAGLLYSINSDGVSCTITGIGTCSDSDLNIPPTIDGYKVTSIGYRAFFECDQLISVAIPHSVTSIGEQSFYLCLNLNNVTISDSVETICTEAFRDCISLANINGGSGIMRIYDRAFYECSMLKNITLNKAGKLKEIGEKAFYNCRSLTTITIPDSVTEIGVSAFEKCNGLTSITLPFTGASMYATGYKSHFGYIFGYSINTSYSSSYCNIYDDRGNLYVMNKIPYKLKSVTITSKIGEYGFNKCGLHELNILDSVYSVGDYALDECMWNSRYNRYDNAYYLGNNDNPYLVFIRPVETTIKLCNINSATKFIASYAFQDCTNLLKITIPDGVKGLGTSIFKECSSLVSITLPSMNRNLYVLFGGKLGSGGSASIGIPSSLTSVVITGGWKICGDAFNDCQNICSITLPETITTIEYGAFKNCSKLTNISIPNSVIALADDAFIGCDKLVYNEYDNCKYLGNATNPYFALIRVKSLYITSVEIHKDTRFICQSAFENCSKLTSITIPDGVTSIGSYAFEDCTSLKSIQYTGTKEQWEAITKGGYWNWNTGTFTITYNYKAEENEE